MLKLFVDDVRQPPDETWVVLRTAEAAIRCIGIDMRSWIMVGDRPGNGRVKIDIISLDHDLGENVKTGYDIVKYIEQLVVEEGYPAPKLIVHSANPVGRKNMEAGIASIARLMKLNEMTRISQELGLYDEK